MSVGPPQRFPYAPALDGLRALAVVAVLGYHLDIRWMRGGFLGVDLFFVISGFLITRLLVDEYRRTGRIALGGFWVRRFRRLVPPLVIVVGASIVATRLWGVPAQWQTMRGDAIAALAYVANWRFVLNETSYFDTLVGPSPLRHIWSLAVEEQWYVLWPLVMMAVAPWAVRRGRAGWLSIAMLAAGALSAWWMAVLFDPSDVSRVYYGTDTRAQQLLVGAALAWLTVSAHRRFSTDRLFASRAAVSAVFVGFLVAVATVRDEAAWLYHGGLFALSIGAAVLVAAAIVPGNDGPLGWLASPAIVAVGKRSYGIYLWHWPVIVFVGPPMGIDLGPVPLAVVQVAITLCLNEVMYRCIEGPIRSGQIRPRRLLIGWSTGGAIAAFAAVTLLATDLPRLPDIEVLRPDLDEVTADRAMPDASPTASDTVPRRADDALTPVPTDAPADVATAAEGPAAPPDSPEQPRLLLLGDSTALVLATQKPDGLPARWRSVAYAQLGCAVTAGDTIDAGDDRPTWRGPDSICREWEGDWSEVSSLFRPNLSVVMIGAWEVLDHLLDGERLSFPSDEWTMHVEQAVRRAADAATTGGGNVVFLRLPCMNQGPGSSANPTTARTDPARVAAFNGVLESVAATMPTASTVPLDELLCPGGEPLDKINGEDVRFDGVHLTDAGAELVWKWLDENLVEYEPSVG